MTGALVCDGDLAVSGGSPICNGTWMLVQVPTPFDPSTLDPVALAQAFGVGFVVIGAPLAVIFGARAILKMIKG
ncbi:hypothetical protein ACNFH8_29290 [Pseudomonas sp. NY15436]|uniref:hypothetical protein n=1 Tax=Pseudomonas sp. NY15436 TaxID=3400359 RepID=UPI003A8B9365